LLRPRTILLGTTLEEMKSQESPSPSMITNASATNYSSVPLRPTKKLSRLSNFLDKMLLVIFQTVTPSNLPKCQKPKLSPLLTNLSNIAVYWMNTKSMLSFNLLKRSPPRKMVLLRLVVDVEPLLKESFPYSMTSRLI
jgi:hypothetical protein